MKTIVCVEDNVDNLKVLMMMLNRFWPDDKFISARTAEEGLAIIDQLQPDLILMDIDLPGMSGHEALKTLQQQPHNRHIPVVAISAHAMVDSVRDGLAAGFAAYITKPVDMQILRHTLQSYLSQEEVLQMG